MQKQINICWHTKVCIWLISKLMKLFVGELLRLGEGIVFSYIKLWQTEAFFLIYLWEYKHVTKKCKQIGTLCSLLFKCDVVVEKKKENYKFFTADLATSQEDI